MKIIRIKDILWLSQTKFPIKFCKKTPMLSFENKPEYNEIIVHGILKEGAHHVYNGSIIVFYIGTSSGKIMNKINLNYNWLDLKTFIEKFGEYTLNV